MVEGMGGRRAGQSCVKKVGVVVDLYNRSIAFENGFTEKRSQDRQFFGLFKKRHNRFIAHKEWFYRKKIARSPDFFDCLKATQSLHRTQRMVLQKKDRKIANFLTV